VSGPKISDSAAAIPASVFADLAPRIEAFARRGGDLVELHIGDTHLVPPAGARFAAVEPSTHDAELYRYGAVTALPSLREACAAFLAARGRAGRAVDPARHVLVGCGATHALFCAARAVLEAGDEVIVAAPYWPLSVGILRAAGAMPVEVPLTTHLYGEPALDAGEVLETAVTPRTRALYVITPNNPDGKVLGRSQLASIASLAERRGLWIFADEVYADYTYGPEHVSIGALDEATFERTISAYSFSKSHALAGARVGVVVAPERVVTVARRVSTHTVFNVPVVAQRVAAAALAASDAWIQDAKREYAAARDEALAALDRSGARVLPAEGGSYLFVDFADVLDGRPLRALLESAIDRGVLLAPGDGFGQAFGTWARICFTSVPRPRMLEGLARLRAAMHDLAT
jgi:aspartate/methionine/tyrosine aminotransferase